MSITLSILLYIYFTFVFIWLIFSFVSIYHMLKFGFKNIATFFFTFLFIGVSVVILAATYNYLFEVDWTQEIVLFTMPDTSQFDIK